ncbi:class I SAM-dependent methyltransferase [Bythopirellula goksoeyrii]|uniref:THUMP-like domain-containing protein n=1 Tax=Bythopirellula goksoeyrii TaxID=1400387 RepID=A0A5B9QFH1_9BACT|nr:class I SAM-dependent methyltransferase [Bythopirellula goksoeyrii]QEG35656.1 hypothetical protein Pr1d_29580 [Bythopirellula goksoeyrii]
MTEFSDYHWLVSDEARPWITTAAESDLPSHRLVENLRRSLSTERVRLVVEQVGLREKASEKFGSLARQMFFTDRALQQATDLSIARHKAQRFSEGGEIVDYCCGIGGDMLALAERGSVVGVDRDPIMAILADANLRVWKLDKSASMKTATSEECPPTIGSRWHLDPDRRVDGRRSTHPEFHSPSESTIDSWLEASPHGAIKFAPAAVLSHNWQEQAELEWITRARSCRQLVAWFGELAESPGMRRATVIQNQGLEFQTASFVGDPLCEAPLAESISDYVFDTDPSIRASRLTGALAVELGCEALFPGEAYLTANHAGNSPLTSCFKVIDALPFRVPKLAKYLQSLGIGELEIKTRGVSTSPEELRKRLKLVGDRNTTLLVTRQRKKEIAILAERYEATGVTDGHVSE